MVQVNEEIKGIALTGKRSTRRCTLRWIPTGQGVSRWLNPPHLGHVEADNLKTRPFDL